MKKIGFIGAGNMGGALITAACHGNDAKGKCTGKTAWLLRGGNQCGNCGTGAYCDVGSCAAGFA
ncbi:MAG: hypothetical protein RRY96_00390 [Ruthenibacterium sp.]